MEKKKRPKLVAGLFGASVVLVTLGAGCATQTETPVTNPPSTDTTQRPPVAPPTPTPSTEPPTKNPSPFVGEPPLAKPPVPAPATDGKTSYKDGTYTAEGDYGTHVGPESVTVTLTLKKGVVVDSQFQGTPRVMMSGRYMDMFAANYKPLVVGKDIASLQLDKVSGASLTPMGFNDAVSKIKAQAKA